MSDSLFSHLVNDHTHVCLTAVVFSFTSLLTEFSQIARFPLVRVWLG